MNLNYKIRFLIIFKFTENKDSEILSKLPNLQKQIQPDTEMQRNNLNYNW